MTLSVNFLYMVVIILKYVSTICTFWSIFVKNWCWILSKGYSVHTEIIIFYIHQFVNALYYIEWYNEKSLLPWNKFHLIMEYDPFNVLLNFGFGLLVFCSGFSCLCWRGLLPYNFLLCGIFGFRTSLGAFLPQYFIFVILIFKRVDVNSCLNTWWASLVAQMVKRLSAMQETLGWEYPLEKEMAAHSSILAWKILWTTEPGGLPSMWLQRVGHEWKTSISNTW